MTALEHYFQIAARGSRPKTEVVAGITTFAAMSYIIFVQPAIMSGEMFHLSTGMNFDALVTTTCIVSALGCLLMGLLANFPVGLAPGMGENFYFVISVLPVCAALPGMSAGTAPVWQLALGVVFVSGIIFAVISFLNVRKLLLDAISPSLKCAITAGIGLFIALLGLQNGAIIVTQGGHYTLNAHVTSAASLVFMAGLITIVVLHIMKVRGAILIGIVVAALTAALLGEISLVQPFGLPANPAPLIGKMNLTGVFTHLGRLLPLIVIFTFMDVFDTLGTVIGVGTCAGLMKDNQLPDAPKIFAADATATVVGAFCGHSTVTSFIESVTGVETGGRTGLTAVTTAMCFIAAMFLTPCIRTIAMYMPITAPALVLVGAMMLKNVREIDWDDFSEAIPAFLIITGIPFS
ncbi:MAG: NCS2 family permease, partial [Victivallales bacterium]|nr:NCS2 family permease [Victivallales bacterium]